MRIIISFLTFIFAILLMVSCKKDYQALSAEFIQNLPDTCEFLTQVNDEKEHLVYYKGAGNDVFYCYNLETDNKKEIKVPNVEQNYLGKPHAIGAGVENILVIYSDVENLNTSTPYNACVQLYNLKTQSFKELSICDWCTIDYGNKIITCQVFETDRYGDGTRIDEIYDFDGKKLSKKEVEVIDFEEVPTGTLAAREKEAQEQERIQQQNINTHNQPTRTLYYCELCGEEYTDVQALLYNSCLKNKMGSTCGHHKLYEGGMKSVYICRYCGKEYSSIKAMVFNGCPRREFGERHAPALW